MTDEEDLTPKCCAPFLALTEPIEVSELGYVKTRLSLFPPFTLLYYMTT